MRFKNSISFISPSLRNGLLFVDGDKEKSCRTTCHRTRSWLHPMNERRVRYHADVRRWFLEWRCVVVSGARVLRLQDTLGKGDCIMCDTLLGLCDTTMWRLILLAQSLFASSQ